MTEPIDQAVPVAPPEPPYGVPLEVPEAPSAVRPSALPAPPVRKGPGLGRMFATALGEMLGQLFLGLVLFPLLVGW